MGRRKREDSAINDMCIACQFYEWQADKKQYGCIVKGCQDNDKFQVYTPKWLRRDENGNKND